MIKKHSILWIFLILLLLGACSPSLSFGNYTAIEYNGVKYVGINDVPLSNDMGEFVQIFLVGSNGKVAYNKPYEARTYIYDPDYLFLYFDSMRWIKKEFYDEWTVTIKS